MKLLLWLYIFGFVAGVIFFGYRLTQISEMDYGSALASCAIFLCFLTGCVIIAWAILTKRYKKVDDITEEEMQYWMQRLHEDEVVDLSIKEQWD